MQDRLLILKICKAGVTIRASKGKCFKQLCHDTDVNPWGTAYRMIMSRLQHGGAPQITGQVLLLKIIQKLFPQKQNTVVQAKIRNAEEVTKYKTTTNKQQC